MILELVIFKKYYKCIYIGSYNKCMKRKLKFDKYLVFL